MSAKFTCGDASLLKGLLDDRLSLAEQAELTAHLETCETCRASFDALAAGTRWWGELREFVPPGLGPGPTLPMDGARGVSAGEPTQGDLGHGEDADVLGLLDPPGSPDHLGRFGPYDVTRVLGRGGMGVVLLGFDPSLHRPVAIKLLSPRLATSSSARGRFLREARAAASVVHEHVVTIHAVGESGGLPYLVMQYVPGKSLQERIEAAGPLGLKEVLRIGMQAAAGLAAAHAQGLVHRDVKPANILLENGVERVKLTDFGLARAADDAGLTQSGVVAGTPQYMAPEQARGEAVDHRADLFSLGSVLYTMCSGRPPFRGESAVAVLRRVCDDTPRPVREVSPETPDWLEALIARLHAKDPAARFQTAAEVSERLGRHLTRLQEPTASGPRPPGETDTPTAGRPPRRRLALAALALLAAVLVVPVLNGRVAKPRGSGRAVRAVLEASRDGQDVAAGGTTGTHLWPKPPVPSLVLPGLGGEALALAYSADGKTLAAGYNNGSIVLWDTAEARPRLTIQGPPQAVLSLAYSSDGKVLVSCTGYWKPDQPDGEVDLWGVDTGRSLFRLRGHKGSVYWVAFAPDGREVVSVGADGFPRVWDAVGGTLRATLTSHGNWVYAAAYSPDGRTIATAGGDMTVHLNDAVTLSRKGDLVGHTGQIECVAYSPDGRTIASGGRDNLIMLTDAATYESRPGPLKHDGWVSALAFSPDGASLASAALSAGSKHVKLWDVASGRVLATLDGVNTHAVVFAPDGRSIATGHPPGDVKIWDVSRFLKTRPTAVSSKSPVGGDSNHEAGGFAFPTDPAQQTVPVLPGSPASRRPVHAPPTRSNPMSRLSSPIRHSQTRRPVGRNRPVLELLEGRALLAAAGLSFVEPLNLPPAVTGGGSVTGVAKGDFNRDGKLDLAVTYNTDPNGSARIAFLAGNGNGTFQAPVDLTVPASQGTVNLDGILAKDFNRDGKLDLVVAEPNQQALLYYQGNGDGSFAAATVVPSGAKVDSIQTADLNGDGTLDLVGLDQADNTVTALLGLGNGTFSAPTVYANVGKTVTDLAIGDVDGKKGPDLIVASHDDYKLNVLLNDGTGHFGPIVSTAVQYDPQTHGSANVSIRSIAAADFLGNGTTQVVIATDNSPSDAANNFGYGGPALALLRPNGDGTFQIPAGSAGFAPENEYPSHYYSENVAPDLNGDGKPDLLFGHSSGGVNLVTVGLNQGDGTFALSRYVASPGPGPDVPQIQVSNKETNDPGVVLAGDFHGTGVPDIVVGSFLDNARSGGLSLLPAVSSAPGTYRSPRTYAVLPPFILPPAGHSQLLGAFGPGNSQALVSLVSENFTGPNNTPTPALYLSPVNPDGTIGSPSAALSSFGGTGSFYSSLATADFNGDGKPDLVYLHSGSAQGGPTPSIVVAYNTGSGGFTSIELPVPQTPVGYGPTNVSVGDFNGDGKPDLAVVETSSSGTGSDSSQLQIFLNNGNNTFTSSALLPLGYNAGYGVAVGDFNGDGKVDVVANHSAAVNTAGDVELFKGNGDGTFAAPVVIGAPPTGDRSATQFLGVDLRHNGRLDLVGIGYDLQVYLNNGGGTFSAPVVYAAGSGPNDFRLADLNNDGNLDATVAGQQGLFVLTGNGDGTFNPSQQFAVGQANQANVNVGDVNGDGRPDVVTERSLERAGDATTVLLAAPLPGPSAGFVIGSDAQVYTHALNGLGNPTGGYIPLAYGQVRDLAVTRFGDKTSFEAFVIGFDGQGYAATISGSTRSGYFHTAYGSTASVSAGTDALGNPLLFAIGTDHQLYEQKFNSAGRPTSGSYTKAASGDFKTAVTTHDTNGNPLLFAVGQDGQVYGLKLDASGSAIGGLFKVSPGAVQQLAVGHDASNNPELFVLGTDNAVYLHKLDASGGSVGPYVQVGGLVYTISVTNDGANNPELFAVGLDSQVYGHKFDAAGNSSGGFFHAPNAPGGVYSATAGLGANNSPSLYVTYANDAQVYAAPFNPSGDPTGPFTLTTPGQVKKVVLA